MGHRFGQIHVFAAADFEHRVARDDIFFERGESDGRLDGGARNRAGGISHFLIDDGEDAAGGGSFEAGEELATRADLLSAGSSLEQIFLRVTGHDTKT